MAPELSVIVCHHKGGFIYKFVESVKKSVNVTVEIIVVTSDDELALKGIRGCLVINNYDGPAAKRNMGARLAKAPILAFFDDDVEIDPKCLSQFAAMAPNTMAYGKLHNAEHQNRFDEAGGFLTSTGFIWSRAGQNDIDNGQYDTREQILAGKSASCAIWADLFNEVDGFDEDFWILGEETDLSWRVWLSGGRVWYFPKALGIHYFNTKWKPANEFYTSKRVHFNGCRNYITMLIKNLEARNLWKILPTHCLIWFSASVVMLFTGKPRQGVNILLGLIYVLKNLGVILSKRKRIQENRVRSDRELWPYIFSRAPRGYYTQRFLRYLKIGLHG